MSIEYVPVSEGELDEPIELPTEEDGALLLSTVAAQFAGASGLKYRAGGGGGRLRGLRLTGEDAVRDYFAAFGDLLMVQVKRDAKSGLSKGFGFVKFASYEAQLRALGRRHMIDGRWCDVRIPNGKDGGAAAHRKVFVGRCTEALSADDLREYFAHFGQVTDVFVPRPFRAFSFVTFLEPEVAQSLCGQDHIIKGVSVNISTASPKRERSALPAGALPPGSRGSLVGWGLLEGGRVFNWAGDAWPQPPQAPLHADAKPYLKYE
ncbi:TAR DNA binding protein-like protein [Operophtera brumata]|uniref:TAR DNA binding protein-like protein n=1 Tax=Operophtera brumata TaxID=104452 RepID=A0A0L7KN35_OPEBR|nr:TAR DNA binding protein-like protein [Operophtera brumata]